VRIGPVLGSSTGVSGTRGEREAPAVVHIADEVKIGTGAYPLKKSDSTEGLLRLFRREKGEIFSGRATPKEKGKCKVSCVVLQSRSGGQRMAGRGYYSYVRNSGPCALQGGRKNSAGQLVGWERRKDRGGCAILEESPQISDPRDSLGGLLERDTSTRGMERKLNSSQLVDLTCHINLKRRYRRRKDDSGNHGTPRVGRGGE